MIAANLREGQRIKSTFDFLSPGGSIAHYFTVERREPDWLAPNGWWAVNGQAVTTNRDGSKRTGREIDTPIGSLALDKFEVVSPIGDCPACGREIVGASQNDLGVCAGCE